MSFSYYVRGKSRYYGEMRGEHCHDLSEKAGEACSFLRSLLLSRSEYAKESKINQLTRLFAYSLIFA